MDTGEEKENPNTTPRKAIDPCTGREFVCGPYYDDFSKRMAEFRASQGWKLEQARDILGLSVGFIHGLEHGQKPVSDHARRAYHRAAPEAFPIEEGGLLL